MDFFISLEYDVVVKLGVGHMLSDPLLFQTLMLVFDRLVASLNKLFRREIQEELLAVSQVSQRILVLIDLAAHLRDVLVQLLDPVILSCLLLLQFLLLLFTLLPQRLVLRNVVMQVLLVVFKLQGAVFERLISTLLLLFELFDLLLDRVVGELCQEHLLLLLDELVGVLGTLLTGELDPAARNVHRPVNMVLLLDVVVALLIVALGRRNVTVLDAV